MVKKTREVLKGYFQEGALPTADHFASLIESTLNLVDEGFDKTSLNGFEIRLPGNGVNFISLFEDLVSKHPKWSISFDKETDTLLIARRDGKGLGTKVISLSDSGNVGIHNPAPEHALDVAGNLRSASRLGGFPTMETSVSADGKWHRIIGPLSGCHAFEVMAGAAGKARGGQYALMHAVAMSTHNPRGWLQRWFNFKSGIRYTHAYFLSRGNRLKLRWAGTQDEYYLEIKSACCYESGSMIRFHVTQLWLDSQMEGCRPQEDEGA